MVFFQRRGALPLPGQLVSRSTISSNAQIKLSTAATRLIELSKQLTLLRLFFCFADFSAPFSMSLYHWFNVLPRKNFFRHVGGLFKALLKALFLSPKYQRRVLAFLFAQAKGNGRAYSAGFLYLSYPLSQTPLRQR